MLQTLFPDKKIGQHISCVLIVGVYMSIHIHDIVKVFSFSAEVLLTYLSTGFIETLE